jgi:hypothetical protein
LDDRWEVRVTPMDRGWHVCPVKGFMSEGNWALSTNPKRSTSFWSALTGRYIRMEYPKTERQLERAVALCREFCDRHNAHRAANEQTAQRFAPTS